jgi:hypothetical protein
MAPDTSFSTFSQCFSQELLYEQFSQPVKGQLPAANSTVDKPLFNVTKHRQVCIFSHHILTSIFSPLHFYISHLRVQHRQVVQGQMDFAHMEQKDVVVDQRLTHGCYRKGCKTRPDSDRIQHIQ